MRVALWVSSLGHAAIVGWAVVAYPGTDRDVTPPAPLPVDIVSIEEFTQVTAGIREAEPEAEPEAPEAAEETPPSELPEPEPEPETEQSAAPEPLPEARPEPEPEIDLSTLRTASLPDSESEPEPTPEPTPEAEAEPAPMPTEVPLPRARPETAEQAPRVSEPEPEAEPEPRRDPPSAPEEPSFDADRIAALLDRMPDSGGAVHSDAIGDMLSHGAPTARDERLSMSEIDALRRQIARCWNPPVGVLEADEQTVRIELRLNRDGSLARPPQVLDASSGTIFTVAAEAATRAVNRCQPYDLPADKFDLWQHIHVNFDPREMLGG